MWRGSENNGKKPLGSIDLPLLQDGAELLAEVSPLLDVATQLLKAALALQQRVDF